MATTTHDRQLKNAGKFYGTFQRANELRKQRLAAKDVPAPTMQVWRGTVWQRTAIIEPDDDLVVAAASAARTKYPHRKNWISPEADRCSKCVLVHEVNNGRYSSRCTYTHWTYRPMIRSCGIVSRRRLLWFRGSAMRKMIAPKGYRFGRDDLGLYVERSTNARIEFRYHFCGNDLKNKSTLRAAYLEHEQRQHAAAKKVAARVRSEKQYAKLRQMADKLGVCVMVRDSLASGNCEIGTIRWMEQHSIPRATVSLPVSVVKRLSSHNGHRRQAERAIEAAYTRTVADLERGYCTL